MLARRRARCPAARRTGADADHQRARPIVGAEGGGQPAGRRGDRETRSAASAWVLAQLRVLVEGQFRFGVNRVRQFDQIGTTGRDDVLDVGRRGDRWHPAVSHPPRPDSRARRLAVILTPSTRYPGHRRAHRRGAPRCGRHPRFGLGAGRRGAGQHRPPTSRCPGCPASSRRRPRPPRPGAAGADRVAQRAGPPGPHPPYEGHELCATSSRCAPPSRPRARRGVVLTNAAGGLRPEYWVGQPVLISDHLNLTARSPLTGASSSTWSTRTRRGLWALARRSTRPDRGGLRRVARTALRDPGGDPDAAHPGADLVGMSTVHETITARAVGGGGAGTVAGDQPGRRDDGRAAQSRRGAGRRPASATAMGTLLGAVLARL